MKKKLMELKIQEEANNGVQENLNREISEKSDHLNNIESCITEMTTKIMVSNEEIERLRMFMESLEEEIALLYTTNEDLQFEVNEQNLRREILGKAVKM